ncbi:MAG: SDR family NAD(P)-dependent oxidoreductase [Vicinamibacterales bacterium]
MAKVIAVVGAGPGIGMAVAERFGREGFTVALVARNAARLATQVDTLRGRGITAEAFPADVLDRPALVQALERAGARFGGIDVLEYGVASGVLQRPLEITPEGVQGQLDVAVLGPVAAVQTVLPGMLARKDGGILFTTAGSCYFPMAFTANFGVAAGAQLNYARVLHHALAPLGIYAGIVAVSAMVAPRGVDPATLDKPGGFPITTLEAVSQAHWDLYTKRNAVDAVVGDLDRLRSLAF